MNKELHPFDKLFKATAGLQFAWENRSRFGSDTSDDYRLLSAMADQLSATAAQTNARVEDQILKNGISRMSKAYRDAVFLHGLVLRRSEPLASEAVQRAENLREIKELKERRYREWDDPVIRDETTIRIEVIEANMRMMRLRASESTANKEQRMNEKIDEIDQLAKQNLKTYRLENEWSEAPSKTAENVFDTAVKTSALIRGCIKQPTSCSALGPAMQSLPAVSTSSQKPENPLVGTWKLDFMAGNNRAQPIFIIGRQGDTYSAVVSDSVEQTHFTAMSVSESSFSFVSSALVGKYSARLSGNIDGARIVGTISMTDATGGTYTVPFTGTRIGP